MDLSQDTSYINERVIAQLRNLEVQKKTEYNSIMHWYTVRRDKVMQELNTINRRYEELVHQLEDKYNRLAEVLDNGELEQVRTFIPFVYRARESAREGERARAIVSSVIEDEGYAHFPPMPKLERQRAVRPGEADTFLEEFATMNIDFAEPRNVVYNIVSDDEDDE